MLRGCAPLPAKQSIRLWIYTGNTSTYAFITATSNGLESGVFVVVGVSFFCCGLRFELFLCQCHIYHRRKIIFARLYVAQSFH